MSRLPEVKREQLDSDAQAVWDRIAAVRGGVRGPYGVLINRPRMADHIRGLEDYFRFDAELPEIDRELAILVAAREAEARYAWARHEVRANEVGLRKEALELVRARGSLDGLTPRERVIADVVLALLREKRLSPDLFGRAQAELGTEQLVELVALIGHYSLVAYVINGFDVDPPEGLPQF